MIGFIIRRTLQAILVVVIVTALVFVAMRMMPGDPLQFYISQQQLVDVSQEQIDLLRHQFGLDKPIVMQYFDWVKNMAQGNLGYSMSDRMAVTRSLSKAIPITLYLGVISFIIGNILGIFFGLICAIKRGRAADLVVTILANIGITIPSFWLAIIMIYIISLKLGWLPTHGFTWPWVNFGQSVRQSIMPVFCLSLGAIAAMTRQTRSVMLEVIRQDYVRTAWAKGLSENIIIIRHIIRNGFIPIMTLIGLGASTILGGSVIVETVFNIAGMGRLAISSIQARDYPVTQAIVLLSAILIVGVNLLVDISYGWIDPRVRYS